MGRFLAENIMVFELFSKSVCHVFLKLYLMTGIKKYFDITVLDFEGKFIICPQYGGNGC